MIHAIAEAIEALIKSLVGVFIILNIVWGVDRLRLWFKFKSESTYHQSFLDELMLGLWIIIVLGVGSALLIFLGYTIYNLIFK